MEISDQLNEYLKSKVRQILCSSEASWKHDSVGVLRIELSERLDGSPGDPGRLHHHAVRVHNKQFVRKCCLCLLSGMLHLRPLGVIHHVSLVDVWSVHGHLRSGSAEGSFKS